MILKYHYYTKQNHENFIKIHEKERRILFAKMIETLGIHKSENLLKSHNFMKFKTENCENYELTRTTPIYKFKANTKLKSN